MRPCMCPKNGFKGNYWALLWFKLWTWGRVQPAENRLCPDGFLSLMEDLQLLSPLTRSFAREDNMRCSLFLCSLTLLFLETGCVVGRTVYEAGNVSREGRPCSISFRNEGPGPWGNTPRGSIHLEGIAVTLKQDTNWGIKWEGGLQVCKLRCSGVNQEERPLKTWESRMWGGRLFLTTPFPWPFRDSLFKRWGIVALQ